MTLPRPHAAPRRAGTHRFDPNAAKKAQMAFDLAVAGHTYQEIAEACGYSNRKTAWAAIQRELARTLTPKVEEYRTIVTMRLERIYKSVHPIAIDPTHIEHLWAVDRALVINAQLSKLHGLEVVQPKELTAAVMPTIREYPEGVMEAV